MSTLAKQVSEYTEYESVLNLRSAVVHCACVSAVCNLRLATIIIPHTSVKRLDEEVSM